MVQAGVIMTKLQNNLARFFIKMRVIFLVDIFVGLSYNIYEFCKYGCSPNFINISLDYQIWKMLLLSIKQILGMLFLKNLFQQ